MHLNFSKETRLTSLSGALPSSSPCQAHTHTVTREDKHHSEARKSREAPGSSGRRARPPRGHGHPAGRGRGGTGHPVTILAFHSNFILDAFPGASTGHAAAAAPPCQRPPPPPRAGPGRAVRPLGSAARQAGGRAAAPGPASARPGPGPGPAEGLPVYRGQPQPRSYGGLSLPCPQPRRDRQRGFSSPAGRRWSGAFIHPRPHVPVRGTRCRTSRPASSGDGARRKRLFAASASHRPGVAAHRRPGRAEGSGGARGQRQGECGQRRDRAPSRPRGSLPAAEGFRTVLE